ncbi:hypothetical protein AHF37_11007 [Paragonimus kellicotti]|nr:hypothetical protein AHF37_11007 [Paragonimus kellicotti]
MYFNDNSTSSAYCPITCPSYCFTLSEACQVNMPVPFNEGNLFLVQILAVPFLPVCWSPKVHMR